MNILTRGDIENLYTLLHPKLELSNIINVDDEELSSILHYFLFLQQFTKEIVANSHITYEEVLYSQLYWFVTFKNDYYAKFGYDGGMDQQAFLLIECIANQLEGEVDWEFIKSIENQ